MSQIRLLVPPLLATAVLLLSGSTALVGSWRAAPGEQDRGSEAAKATSAALSPGRPVTRSASPPAGVPDGEATRRLDQALAQLAPARLQWLEVTLWQQVTVQGLRYEAEGRYLAGPGRRSRLELKTHTGATEGVLEVVDDGTSLWQATQLKPGHWSNCSRVRLQEVLDTLDEVEAVPRVRDEFWQGQGGGSVTLLLPRLRPRMDWGREEDVRQNGHTFHRLTGTWTAAEAASLAPGGREWPAALPRRCRLYLDAETLWPQRLEWWGPAAVRAEDSLLVQLEFRDPVLNQPLNEERCAREFHPDVDPASVPDTTEAVTGRLRARAAQLSRAP